MTEPPVHAPISSHAASAADAPATHAVSASRVVAASIVVGVVATCVDLALLAVLTRALGLSPLAANVPCLVTGAAVQFVGCRYLVFPGARRGAIGRQLAGFTVATGAGLVLNAVGFHALHVVFAVAPELARLVASFVVFLAFSVPSWRVVFAPPP